MSQRKIILYTYVDAFGRHARLFTYLLFSSNWIERVKEIHTCGFCQKKEEETRLRRKKGAERAVTTQVREREKGLHYTSLGGGGGAEESLVEL
jgi:hypothetical protein